MNHILGLGSKILDMKAEQSYEAISQSPIKEHPSLEGGLLPVKSQYQQVNFSILQKKVCL